LVRKLESFLLIDFSKLAFPFMFWLRFCLPEVQIQLVSLPHTLTLTWDMVGKKGGLAHGRETCVLSLIQNNPLL